MKVLKRNMEELVELVGDHIISAFAEDPGQNIITILKGTQKIFNARMAIYNRFNDDYTELTTYTSEMDSFEGTPDNSEGHICTDVALKDLQQPSYIKDLFTTNYLYTDAAVKSLNLRTYFGVPVRSRQKVLGVLSVVYDQIATIDEVFQQLLKNMAALISAEENYMGYKLSESLAIKKYEAIFNNSSLGILLLKDNNVLEVNDVIAGMLKMKKEEILNNSLGDLSPKYQSDGNLSVKKMIVYYKAAKKKRKEFDWIFKKANGTPVYTHMSLSPVVQGKDIFVMALIQDITKFRNHEMELVRAREKAENADKLKSIFLANMSHEIRTPLNSIIGFSDLLLDEESTKEDRAMYADMIKTAGKSLLQLIEDIIDISKIEAGQLKIRKKKFDVNESLNKLYLTAEKEKQSRGKSMVELKLVRGYKGKLEIESDEVRFQQIFLNLLTNALKFTEKGFIEFGYIGITQTSIQFYVKDTGTGIAPDEVPLIFRRFGQANQDYTQNKEGKGLGLAITQSLVKLLGGTIWVDSMPGKGSTFYFTLPVNREEAMTVNPLYGALYEDAFAGKTILVVDNEINNYNYIKGSMSITGADFAYSKGGREAVKFCLENDYIDIVLMDIVMPDVDGYEATRQIKKAKPELPIIAITAFNNQEEKIDSLKAGCDDYVPKPINFNELFGLLSRYLKK